MGSLTAGAEFSAIFDDLFAEMTSGDRRQRNSERVRRAKSQLKSRKLEWLGLDVLQECVLHPHYTDAEIAKAIGCSVRTVKKYRQFAHLIQVPFFTGGHGSARICVKVKLKSAAYIEGDMCHE